MLRIYLPLPPTVNHVYVTTRAGRRVMGAPGKQYSARAYTVARIAAQTAGWAYPAGGRLSVALKLHFPDRRRCDIDNRAKVVVDVLAKALGFDDSAIDRLLLERGAVDKLHPRCEAVVELIHAPVRVAA